MTFVEDVQRAKSPREAMLNLAAGLDVLVERIDRLESTSSWDEWHDEPVKQWDSSDAHRAAANGFVTKAPVITAPQIHVNGEETDVDIPPPTEERMAYRRLFENQQLHLADHLGNAEDWTEVYAKGGPQWLYIGNPELVKGLPYGTRQALVTDLEQDSPQQAKEMARDILKAPADATGYGNAPALADEFAGGVSGIRGTG